MLIYVDGLDIITSLLTTHNLPNYCNARNQVLNLFLILSDTNLKHLPPFVNTWYIRLTVKEQNLFPLQMN